MISLANISCSLRVGLALVVVVIASQSNCHVRAGEIVEFVGFMGCVRPQIALSLVLIINQCESICGGGNRRWGCGVCRAGMGNKATMMRQV